MIRRDKSGLSLKVVAVAAFAVAALTACSPELVPADVVAQARQLIEAGKANEAHIRLRALLAEHPDSVEARLLAAQLALDSGDPQGADAALLQLTVDQLRAPSAQSLRYWVDLGLGRHAEVLKALDQSATPIAQPEQARLRAAALRGLGLPTDALVVLREGAVEVPDDALLVVDIATTLTAIGSLRQAEYELDAFLGAHPRQADALRVRGELRLRNGATAKAMEDLREALEAAPLSWSIVKRVTTELLLGDATLAAGNVQLAKEQVAAVEKRLPGTVGAQLLSARIALLEGRAGDAAEMLQGISSLMPDNVNVQYLLADAWLRSGGTARAMDLLERRVREGDPTARRLLAGLLLRQNRPDRVIELLGELPQASGASASDEENLLSTARLAQARAGEAIASLETRLQENPQDVETRIRLAASFLQNGQTSRASAIMAPLRGSTELPAAVATELAIQFALRNDREVNRLVATLVDSESTSIDVLLAAADAAQEAGKNDTVARLVDRALQRDAQNPGALLRRANLDFVDRRYDAALDTIETLVRLDSKSVQARLAHARVLETKGDGAAAAAALEAAIQTNPELLEPALALAGLELRAGQQAVAVRVLDAMVDRAASDGIAANAAGILLLNAGRAEEARTRFGQAIEQQPENAAHWLNLGRAQLQSGDRQAAAQSFARTVDLRPEWMDANIAAIQLSIELRHHGEAVKMAAAVARKLPSDARSWLLVGEAELASGNATGATAAFARSYALQPSSFAAMREHLSRVAAESPRPDQPLQNWLNREPADVAVRQQLAQFYLAKGASADSTREFEEVVRLAPNHVVALNNLAWLIVDTDPGRAEQLARRASSITPQEPAIADTLGWTLILNGKYPEAVRVLENAVEALPENRSVRYRYALALARSGATDAARRELRAALAGGVSFEGRDAAQKLNGELGS